MFRVGDVLSFHYQAGTNEQERLGKVLKVRDVWMDPVQPVTIRRNVGINRNRYLVTVKQSDGNIRSLYTDEMAAVRPVGTWERIKLWAAGVRF